MTLGRITTEQLRHLEAQRELFDRLARATTRDDLHHFLEGKRAAYGEVIRYFKHHEVRDATS